MLSSWLQKTLHKEKILFNVVLKLLGQYCKNLVYAIWYNVVQVVADRQHCTGKIQCCPVQCAGQCCLNILGAPQHRQKSYDMFSLRLQTTLHQKKSCSMLSQYSWDIIAQVKTLHSIVQEAPHNIAQEKILFSVVLIHLMRQHCAFKSFVECCPFGSRQHLHKKKSYLMLS